MSREAIIKTAEKLFFVRGTKAVSIDDVATELGMSKKTIYTFFASKDDIITSMLDLYMSNHTCDIETILKSSRNAIDELVAIYRLNFEQHTLLKPVFVFDIKKYHPSEWARLELFFSDCVYRTVFQNIERGQKEGLYRENINIDFISHLYFKSIFIIIDYFSIQKKYSIADLDQEHMYYHIHAIGTNKGIKYLDKIQFDK